MTPPSVRHALAWVGLATLAAGIAAALVLTSLGPTSPIAGRSHDLGDGAQSRPCIWEALLGMGQRRLLKTHLPVASTRSPPPPSPPPPRPPPAAAAASCDADDLSQWTLPPGFVAMKYHEGSIKSARSLSISRTNAKLNGPVVVYVSTQNLMALFNPNIASRPNTSVYAMVDLKGRGAADYVVKIVDGAQLGGTPSPNGIAWCGSGNGTLYIAALQADAWMRLFRIDNVDALALENRTATTADIKLVRDDLPYDAMHGWKYIKCDANNLYVPIGSNLNIGLLNGTAATLGGSANVTNYRASRLGWVLQTSRFQKNSSSYMYEYGSIYRFPLGSRGVTGATAPIKIATGVRNTVGFDFDTNGNMYFTDNGRDNIGGDDMTITNNSPDCELNYLPGASTATSSVFYGYPYCHTGSAGNDPNFRPYLRNTGVGRSIVDPDTNLNEAAMKCNTARLPYKPAIQAEGPHFAPLGAFLYNGVSYLGQALGGKCNFQPYDSWTGTLFVASHGSWNRDTRTVGPIGAKVTAHKVSGGTVSKYSSFFSGGVPGDTGLPTGPASLLGTAFTGRPVDIVQLPDGSLLVSDDQANRVVRIANCQSSPAAGPSAIYGTGRCGTYQRRRTETSFSLGNDVGNNPCTVNMGNGVLKSYVRCREFDLASPSKVFGSVGYNLLDVNSTHVVVDVAFVVNDFGGVNGNGWAGVGVGCPGNEMERCTFLIGRTAATASGAGFSTYFVPDECENPRCFTAPKPNFFWGSSLSAAVAGKAMVLTFGVAMTKRDVAAGKTFGLKAALGQFNDAAGGVYAQHWMIDQLRFTPSSALVGVVAPTGTPINPERGPSAAVPPASNATLDTNCTTNPCCVDSTPFMSCTATSDAGTVITHYYTLDSSTKTLKVAVKGSVAALPGTSKGWIAWGYNKQSPGSMVGTEALFVRYQGPGAADWVKAVLGGYATSAFTTPPAGTSIFNNVASKQLSSGELLLTFQVNMTSLPTGLVVNYATGPYNGGAGFSGMGVHITPAAPKGCVNSFGLGPVGCTCQ